MVPRSKSSAPAFAGARGSKTAKGIEVTKASRYVGGIIGPLGVLVSEYFHGPV